MSDHSHKLAPDDFIRLKVKAELRKRLRGVRKTTPAEACLERSLKIARRLEAHEAVVGAEARSQTHALSPAAIALFCPIESRHEVDLRGLDERFRARGVRVAYPSIEPESGVMTFRFATALAALEDKGYGFLEPASDAPEATELDVIIVPALAVDPTGHRIGYGAGYYDRVLPRYAPPAVSIAVAYDWQLVAEVPATAHDVRCAWVVTDVRTFDARHQALGTRPA